MGFHIRSFSGLGFVVKLISFGGPTWIHVFCAQHCWFFVVPMFILKKQVTPCVTCLGASCTLGFLDRSVIYHMDRAFVRHMAHYRSSAGQMNLLGGGFKYFLFSTLPGEMIQFD